VLSYAALKTKLFRFHLKKAVVKCFSFKSDWSDKTYNTGFFS